MLVISLLIISPFNTGKWTAGESWEFMKIPQRDWTAGAPPFLRKVCCPCWSTSLWPTSGRYRPIFTLAEVVKQDLSNIYHMDFSESRTIKVSSHQENLSEKSDSTKYSIWNNKGSENGPLEHAFANACWTSVVPWCALTTSDHGRVTPLGMPSSTPRHAFQQPKARQNDSALQPTVELDGIFTCLPIFEGNLHVGKGRFSRIGPPGCWLKSLKFRIHQKKWCVCDGNFWGYLGFENPLASFGWNGVLHFQRYTSRYTPR